MPMLRGVKHFLTSPWLLVPLVLALGLALSVRFAADQGAYERPLDRQAEAAPGVALTLERGWFGGEAPALRLHVANRSDEPFALNPDGALALRDERGGRYAVRPPADDPELAVPPHSTQTRDLLFVGPLEPQATSLSLERDGETIVPSFLVARTGAGLGTAPPESSAVLETTQDRGAELEAALAEAERGREAEAQRAAELEGRMAELDEARTALAQELEAARAGVGDQLERLAGGASESAQQLSSLEATVASLAQRIDDLMAVRELAQEEAAGLEQELAEVQARRDEEVQALGEQLDVARSRAEDLEQQLAELEAPLAELEPLRANHETALATIGDLSQRIEAIAAERDALRDQLEVARAGAGTREQELLQIIDRLREALAAAQAGPPTEPLTPPEPTEPPQGDAPQR